MHFMCVFSFRGVISVESVVQLLVAVREGAQKHFTTIVGVEVVLSFSFLIVSSE